jgi:hypothetical protein
MSAPPSLWGKVKGGVAAGADATKRAANKVKYKGLIANKKTKIHEIKMRLGVGLYEAFSDADESFKEKLFQDARRKIFELEGHILRTEVKIRDKCDPKFVPTFQPSTEATALTAAPKGAKQSLEEKEAVYNSTASPRNRATSSAPRSTERDEDEPAMSTSDFLGSSSSSEEVKGRARQETKQLDREPAAEGGARPSIMICVKCQEEITGDAFSSTSSDGVTIAPLCTKCSQIPEPASPQATTGGSGKELSGTPALLAWAQQSTEGFHQVEITNFTSSWVSGLAFAALVCNWRPELLNFSNLQTIDTEKVISAAFEAAEAAGVAVLLDPEDVQVADKKSTITQVQMFHRALSKNSPAENGKSKWNSHFH